jgi:hypothetical protein
VTSLQNWDVDIDVSKTGKDNLWRSFGLLIFCESMRVLFEIAEYEAVDGVDSR